VKKGKVDLCRNYATQRNVKKKLGGKAPVGNTTVETIDRSVERWEHNDVLRLKVLITR